MYLIVYIDQCGCRRLNENDAREYTLPCRHLTLLYGGENDEGGMTQNIVKSTSSNCEILDRKR